MKAGGIMDPMREKGADVHGQERTWGEALRHPIDSAKSAYQGS
jgi:hypothetical protein